MAEELDEFGIPIKKNTSVELDEFGIPIKKKTVGTTLRSPSQISSTPLKTGFQTPVQQPFDVTKNPPAPERQIVQQPITLGGGSKSDIGYRGTGLNAAFEENINGGYASPSQIAESENLKKIQQAYQGDKKAVQKAQAQPLDANGQLVQGFADEDLEGNRAGYLYNKVLEGVGQIASGAGRNIYGALGAFSTGPIANVAKGLEATGEFERQYAPSVREYLKENVGATVDKRLENKYNGETITSALGGLASSAPAIVANIVSGGVGAATMGLQMFDNAIESINSTEEGRNLDEGTKTFFAGGVAIAQALLEKYSLDKILKSESGIVSDLVTKQALKNAIKATDGKVTGDVFTKLLDKEILNLSNKFAVGGARALDGALLEYGTEFAQEGVSIAGELLTNKATGKPVFDTENVDNWNGFLSNLQRANKSGIAGAIGGGMLGSISALAKLNKNKIEQNDQIISEIDKNLADENLSDATREILVQNKIKLQNEQQEYADKIDQTYDKLDAKSKDKVNEIVEQKLKIQEAILDPAVTPEIKTNLEEQSKELDKELSDIKPVEEVKVTEEVITPKEGVNVEAEAKVPFKDALSGKGVYYLNGEKGLLNVDGQTVTFETNDTIREIGNVDELTEKNIEDFGLEKEVPLNIFIKEDNGVDVDGVSYKNNFSKPAAAINFDKDGNVISVNLETEDGKKRTFRGQRAEEIAYQYKLKEFEQNGNEEQINRAIEEADRLIEAQNEVKPIESKTKITITEQSKPKVDEAKPIVPKTENVEKVEAPVKEEAEQIEPPAKTYGYEDIDAMVDEQQVAKELNQEIIDPTELTPVQQAIRQFGGVTTTEESYAQFGDKNNLSKEARKTSIRKNAQSLDALAEEISANGLEVTPADLVDYIDTFKDGDNKLSKRAEALKEKMFDLTGKKFNKYTISKYVDKINAKARERFLAEMDAPSLSPEEIGIIEQNGINTENIDDIAQKLDWLYEPETFENIKAYLKNEESKTRGSSDESGKPTERVSEKSDGVEKQPKAGDSARNFANKIREGKINKLGGFRAGTGFDAAWDLGIEAVALSIEGGAKIADAIQSGLEAIKKTDWYKGLEDKANFDKQYNDHMQNEYNVVAKESTGITKEQIDATRKELGLEEVTRVSKSDVELKKQADDWMEKNSIPDLITKLEKGALPSDVENVVMRNYISSLEAKNDKSPSAELLKDINRATKVITSARSELGRALRSGVGEIAIEDNLSNFLLDEMDAMGVNTMPQSMIDELAEKYAKGKAAKDAYEEGYEKAKQEFIKQQAETALSKERAKARNRGNVKKTAADYEAERAVYKKSIKEKLKQARSQANAVPVPYLAELIAISPDVAKMVRSYVEQGVSKLDDLVKKIQSDLEEDIDGITENDVRDLIAGEYNAKRPTKNQITADIRELRQQAKLLKQIEDLENGKLPMTESGKIRRTQEIDKLKERIKELEDETGISEAKSIKAKRNYLDKQIEKLRDDLETGNYDVENPVPRKMKLDPETQAKQDEYIKFQKETWKRRDAATYEQLSKPRKAWEKFQQFLGLRRLIQTSLDFSMPFRQAITLTLNPRYIRITADSFANMFKGWASEKQFDRIMFAIENDPLYKDMLDDKLVFSDVDSKDNLKRDEDFRTSFLYHIPYLRLPFLASNRAAAGFVNTARYEMYIKGVDRLKSAGITRETNPEHYKSMANWVMNMTGRGKLLEFMENSVQAQRVLGDTFYGARLMASRFNLLNPNTYAKMPKEVRVEALKDMGAYASVAAATLIGLAAAGATVSLDPDDPDFLKAKWGDKRYDFTTGGMSVYLRFYFKLAKAVVQRLNPKIYGENKDKSLLKKYDKYGAHALKNSANFFRYKLAPNTSYVISGIAGKDALGKDFDPSEFLNFYPMYTEDMIDSYKKGEGALSTFTVLLPNLFGVGMQEYSNKKQSGEAKTPAEREPMREESRSERGKSRN